LSSKWSCRTFGRSANGDLLVVRRVRVGAPPDGQLDMRLGQSILELGNIKRCLKTRVGTGGSQGFVPIGHGVENDRGKGACCFNAPDREGYIVQEAAAA